MTDDFKLEIISPEKVLFSEKVTSVTIPSFEGEMSILSEHIPLITFLRPGLIKILGKKEKEERSITLREFGSEKQEKIKFKKLNDFFQKKCKMPLH